MQTRSEAYDVTFFDEELALIKYDELRTMTRKVLQKAPRWFWTAPASSTGKHHPPDTNGPGGLCRHIRKVVWLVYKYFQCVDLDTDIAVVAALLHDIAKFGIDDEMEVGSDRPQYKRHGEIGAEFIERQIRAEDSDFWEENIPTLLPIVACIERHMGKWGPRQPAGIDQWLLHIADVTAAHKAFVALEFYDPENATSIEAIEEEEWRYLIESDAGTVLNFGKYKGWTVEAVLKDPIKYEYINWILKEDFPGEVKDKLREIKAEVYGYASKE
jgi:uncharacterized protein (DUF3820 family)